MSAETPDEKPVINLDEDPDNANWLRILAQKRQSGQPPDQPAHDEPLQTSHGR